ncbi:MAG: thioredoxin domain-containing protein [bacterium]|nr:thioredoxin domain-containing protein [bacterium]
MTDSSESAARTPALIREHGNHLVDSPSLYLRQHAHNPLDWYPWGDEALEKAKREDKPIFLSIGYSSCHWCHVMEHEVFEHDDVAAYMNEHFVCIKVDREERPDLDTVYMTAVQMLTGRGGWPMSVWLTPDLEPFFGGTYYPKAQFMQLVQQIVTAYTNQREDLEKQADLVAERIKAQSDLETADKTLDRDLVASAVSSAEDSYDPQFHGFRQQQKFPTPIRWRFLLHQYRRSGKDELRLMLTRTLDAMQGGGLYDHVGGGFHRYTVDTRWTVPHFEKMLYDNGQLAGLFLEAGMALDRPDWTATGLDVLDFLMRDMRDPAGGFYASYDADSGGEEGTYYVWSRKEITATVGEADGPALADLLGVTAEGNFEHTGKSVLTRRADMAAVAAEHGRTTGELAGLFAAHRATLREVRSSRTPPGLDPKVVMAWNGLVLESLAQATALTGRPEYLEAAELAAEHLLRVHKRDDGTWWRTSVDGATSGEAILDDYAFLAAAFLEMYQVSGDLRWLAEASDLVSVVRRDFAREEGGWYISSSRVEAPLGRSIEYFDSVEPAGMSAMYVVLLDLAALTGETKYRNHAEQDLEAWGGLLERAGSDLAWWFEAVDRIVWPHYDVVIAGENDTLAKTFLQKLPADAVLLRVAPGGPTEEQLALAPALAGKKAVDGRATAYVCEFGTCQAPTPDSAVMLKQLGLE